LQLIVIAVFVKDNCSHGLFRSVGSGCGGKGPARQPLYRLLGD